MKEFVLEKLTLGTRKEFISAFWEYIVLLEITYKILEKDQKRAKYDSKLQEQHRRLQDAYNLRVDTGSGDFSERLNRLTDRIVERFGRSDTVEQSALSSSKVLEIVYGAEIRSLRDEINAYLKIKGVVFFLFDNIDRFWSQTGFDSVDALIIVGLMEALQEVKKRFGRSKTKFEWVTFIRSDVFEFVVKGMADYGKIPVASVEWNDEQLLLSLLEHRMMAHFVGKSVSWNDVWNRYRYPPYEARPLCVSSQILR